MVDLELDLQKFTFDTSKHILLDNFAGLGAKATTFSYEWGYPKHKKLLWNFQEII